MEIRNEGDFVGLFGKYARLQAQYWADPKVDGDLKADATATLKQYGLEFDEKQHVEVVINEVNINYLIIPARPAGLSEAHVDKLVAEGTFGTAGSVGTAGTICGTAATFGSLGTFGCSSL